MGNADQCFFQIVAFAEIEYWLSRLPRHSALVIGVGSQGLLMTLIADAERAA